MNKNIYHIKSGVNYSNKLYAILNTKTMKLETTLTNPGHKFWEIKGRCKKALVNYQRKYEKSLDKARMVNPNDLKVVQFNLLLDGYLED